MIVFDSDFKELYPMTAELDAEIGYGDIKNNIVVETGLDLDQGIYIPGTEIGGLVERIDYNNYSADRSTTVITWRGLLQQCIIIPPSGQDYKTVSGDANTIIRDLLSGALGGLFNVPNTASGCNISNYSFNLYTDVLEGLTDMLKTKGYRLRIWANKDDSAKRVKVYIEAVPIVTREEFISDEDNSILVKFVESNGGINHLICLGTGQLQERQRIDLYVDGSGNVGRTKHYTGLKERIAIFDYNSAQSLEDLESYGAKRLLELYSPSSCEIGSVEDNSGLWVSDSIRIVHRETGRTGTANINKVIYKIQNGSVTISYGVEGA